MRRGRGEGGGVRASDGGGGARGISVLVSCGYQSMQPEMFTLHNRRSRETVLLPESQIFFPFFPSSFFFSCLVLFPFFLSLSRRKISSFGWGTKAS